MTRPPVVIHQYQAPESFFLQDLLRQSFQKWPWFLVALVISMGLCYSYFVYKQPIYQVSAKLLIKDQQKGIEEINTQNEGSALLTKKNIENEIEVLYSSILMKRVVEKLNLTVRYYEPKQLGNWEIFETVPFDIKYIKATPLLYSKDLEISFPTPSTMRIDNIEYPVGKPILTAYGMLLVTPKQPLTNKNQLFKLRFVPIKQRVEQLLKELKVEPADKNSTVVQLTIEDVLPTRGEAVLTQLLREYTQASILEKNELAATTLHFIDQRIKDLSAEVVRVENQVESYKSTQKITDLSNQADNLLKTAQDNDTQVNQVMIQLATLDDLEKYMKNQAGKRSISPSTLGLQDQALIGSVERLNQLEQERTELEKLTSDQNFLVNKLTNQINARRLSIQENIQTMRTMLNSSKQQLQNRNAVLESQIRTIPQQERALIDITRQQTIKNELYTYMLKKREEMALSLGAAFSDNLIIDPPKSTSDPIKPVKIKILGFFILVGLSCPLGVIAGKKIFGKQKGIEQQIAVPISGEIIQDPLAQSLVVSSMHQSSISEQIQGLRVNLLLMQSQSSQGLVLLITSIISGEEKTMLSQNLGASLALANFPTVLVEMDLRSPRLYKNFGVSNKLGISNYLKGECEIEAIIQPIPGYDQLYLVSSGFVDSSPDELICNPKLTRLLNALKQRFAFVLVDTTPSSIISDVQLLAPFADTTLFVVRHDITPKNCLQIIDYINLENRFSRPLIVLNDVPEEASYHLNYKPEQAHYYSS
ncbi:GumC family protein [Salmonirosea aquatica]|uniref:Capsular biosynthesis protein n=1 Tax=Salmonirosea aquatica TaxID=2654236 RepID=A0A7C9F598_9BACT|nr:capsular biosynthesis protein [Cytophagaceae bacterium SJW1-29]